MAHTVQCMEFTGRGVCRHVTLIDPKRAMAQLMATRRTTLDRTRPSPRCALGAACARYARDGAEARAEAGRASGLKQRNVVLYDPSDTYAATWTIYMIHVGSDRPLRF